MNEYGICATCRKDYSLPGQDECSPCYLAPFGTAWELEQMERMQEGYF
jgi:hypothetical protein